MRNCTRQRELREAPDQRSKNCPPSRRVQERPWQVRMRPIQGRRKSLEERGRPGVGRSRAGRLQDRALRDRDKAGETKSLLKHLIRSIEDKEHGR
jgi:hypothetical protein